MYWPVPCTVQTVALGSHNDKIRAKFIFYSFIFWCACLPIRSLDFYHSNTSTEILLVAAPVRNLFQRTGMKVHYFSTNPVPSAAPWWSTALGKVQREALWCMSGSYSRTGERLDSSHLESLVEVHIHSLRSLGDLQVPHTASEGRAGNKRRLTNSIWERNTTVSSHCAVTFVCKLALLFLCIVSNVCGVFRNCFFYHSSSSKKSWLHMWLKFKSLASLPLNFYESTGTNKISASWLRVEFKCVVDLYTVWCVCMWLVVLLIHLYAFVVSFSFLELSVVG